MKRSEYLMAQLTEALREEAQALAMGQEVATIETAEPIKNDFSPRQEQKQLAKSIVRDHLRKRGSL